MITDPVKVYRLILIIVIGIIILEGIALLKGFDGVMLSVAIAGLGSIASFLLGRKTKNHHKDNHAKRF